MQKRVTTETGRTRAAHTGPCGPGQVRRRQWAGGNGGSGRRAFLVGLLLLMQRSNRLCKYFLFCTKAKRRLVFSSTS